MAKISGNKQIGKVIFWNKIYGFIQREKNSSIFFHKSAIGKEGAIELQLLDEVSYAISEVKSGKHQGELNATEVEKYKDADFSNYKRYIGILTNWNDSYGYIKSPQQQKSVFFYKTRCLFNNLNYKNGDLLIFHQVKSTMDENQLFALFAYPIFKEKNIDFLEQQYIDSGLEEIGEYIDNFISNSTDFSTEEKVLYKLKRFGFIETHEAYLDLKSIIKEGQRLNSIPEYNVLKKYCAETYLIQLWEDGLIQDYDINIIKRYFHNTNADNKRSLVPKLKKHDKIEILNFHFEKLKAEGKIEHLNNNIKTLLDIVYRNEESREVDIYYNIKNFIFHQYTPEDIINLWLGDYLEDLSESFVIDNININDSHTIKSLLIKEGEKYRDVLRKTFESYFLGLAESDFETEFPIIVKRLKIFENEYSDRFQDILTVLKNNLNDSLIFSLWLFGITTEFDHQKYFVENIKEINQYFKIRFLIKESSNLSEKKTLSLLEAAEITQEEILNIASAFQWNSLISPTEIQPEIDTMDYGYFLKDIKEFIRKFNVKNIDLDIVSLKIYTSLPKYQIHHLRIWLYGYVDDNFYNYIGFREAFRKLTQDEQKLFKDKGEAFSYSVDVSEPEIRNVIACQEIKQITTQSILYSAFLPNLYFGNAYFKLRVEDNSYTKKRVEIYASSGLNRIPVSSELSMIPIEIEVSIKDKEILSVKGLEKIFTIIHTGNIERVLGGISEPELIDSRNENRSYAEDWNLRKQIIDFLNNIQAKPFEPKSVYEPKNFRRRLDENSGIDSKELTRLYTIETEDGHGIVWENIDLTEDRATYIFKTKRLNHKTQLEKIASYIVSSAQLRSTLISNKNQEELNVLRNNLGFIASIRKQRGKNLPFEKWQRKLEKILALPIPELPSKDELTLLVDWTPEVLHNENINRPNKWQPKSIDEGETTIIDLNFSNEKGFNIENKGRKDHRLKLLEALKSFNNTFLEKINPDNNGT